LVGWTSLGSIGTRANVKSEVHNARVLVLQNEIKRTSSIIDKSKASETSESYTHKAEALDRNALTEKRNKFCGRKCRGWKFKAEEMRGLAASAKAKEDAMAAREAAQIELDSKTDEAVLTNGIGIMAAKLGYKDDKFILLSGLMLMITALITVMPFLWIFAFDGAQKSRSIVMQRVKRKVYRRAIAMPGGNVWLSQKFNPDEIVVMATDPATQEAMNAQTSAQVSALSSKLDAMKAAPVPAPVAAPVPVTHTTNITTALPPQNQDAVNRIISTLDGVPKNVPIPAMDFYDAYKTGGGQLPRSSFNLLIPHALAARPNVHI
ncbi:MAG: hypothetical protein GY927_02260, partial [bacterium]|nr:hypothetical protein [bacterium]